MASGERALAATDDAHLMTPWEVIEGTFTHLAHHRRQLSVYLRLNGVALPSLNGPTANEPGI